MIERICQLCKKEFKVKPSVIKRGGGKFCSYLCHNRNYKRKIKTPNGYILIYNLTHPFATKQGYIREHRLIMENYLRRYLEPEERVHHINGIKDDNRLENLKLFPNECFHQKHHNKDKPKKFAYANRKEYQQKYQRKWRLKHPNYFREYLKKYYTLKKTER